MTPFIYFTGFVLFIIFMLIAAYLFRAKLHDENMFPSSDEDCEGLIVGGLLAVILAFIWPASLLGLFGAGLCYSIGWLFKKIGEIDDPSRD